MDIRPFQSSDLEALHSCFIAAFSDYEVPMRPTLDQFYGRLFRKLRIQDRFSYLAWQDEKPIAFLLHAKNLYRGKNTLYNGGTGVIPKARGQRIIADIHDLMLSEVLPQFAQRIVLEVITTNEKAIKLYKKMGYRILQRVKCYKSGDIYSPSESSNIKIQHCESWMPQKYESIKNYDALFVDSNDHVLTSQDHEVLLEAISREDVVGYVLFQPKTGRISQIGIESSQPAEVLMALLGKVQHLVGNMPLTILNIPETAGDIHSYLTTCGFENQLDQYEMEFII
ncbi:MAG: GNAT family N-acetyltransferase [Cyclobacteriaceae bacterium]|nr:GNAT family N-acetyltransferase [Cyclobacteriaceae bacterium HetDA_MAG_MS6]